MDWLRFVGTANAAVWFGSTLFFTFVVGPAFFSTEMLKLFGWPNSGATARYWAGSVAVVVVARYFIVHYCCAGIALVQVVVEWLATGRPLQRWVVYLLLIILGLGLVEGVAIQPVLRRNHLVMYGVGNRITLAQAQEARKSFATWHGLSQVVNLMVLAGLGAYLWHTAQPVSTPRFVGRTRFGWE